MEEIEKLKEAIEHCDDVIKDSCTNDLCKTDHTQLRNWLKELLYLKYNIKI